jgi:hypothetical protein
MVEREARTRRRGPLAAHPDIDCTMGPEATWYGW